MFMLNNFVEVLRFIDINFKPENELVLRHEQE
jgi:hypothetical protein